MGGPIWDNQFIHLKTGLDGRMFYFLYLLLVTLFPTTKYDSEEIIVK